LTARNPSFETMPKSKKKIWKILLIWPLILILLLYIGLWIAVFTVFYFDFMCCKVITAKSIERTPVDLKIPVRYLDRSHPNNQGLSIYTPDKWMYSLHKGDDPGEVYITICRWGLGGLTVYTARYEITDDNIKRELLQRWDTLAQEPLLNMK